MLRREIQRHVIRIIPLNRVEFVPRILKGNFDVLFRLLFFCQQSRISKPSGGPARSARAAARPRAPAVAGPRCCRLGGRAGPRRSLAVPLLLPSLLPPLLRLLLRLSATVGSVVAERGPFFQLPALGWQTLCRAAATRKPCQAHRRSGRQRRGPARPASRQHRGPAAAGARGRAAARALRGVPPEGLEILLC